MLSVDPNKIEVALIGDIEFRYRGLTGREKLAVIPPEVLLGGEPGSLSFMSKVVEVALCGWSNAIPFEKDVSKNVDKLDADEIMILFSKIMSASKLSIEQSGN